MLLANFLTMTCINTHEVKTHLSSCLERAVKSERIISKRNLPVAELVPIRRQRRAKRPIGLAGKEILGSVSIRNFSSPCPLSLRPRFLAVPHEVRFFCG